MQLGLTHSRPKRRRRTRIYVQDRQLCLALLLAGTTLLCCHSHTAKAQSTSDLAHPASGRYDSIPDGEIQDLAQEHVSGAKASHRREHDGGLMAYPMQSKRLPLRANRTSRESRNDMSDRPGAEARF